MLMVKMAESPEQLVQTLAVLKKQLAAKQIQLLRWQKMDAKKGSKDKKQSDALTTAFVKSDLEHCKNSINVTSKTNDQKALNDDEGMGSELPVLLRRSRRSTTKKQNPETHEEQTVQIPTMFESLIQVTKKLSMTKDFDLPEEEFDLSNPKRLRCDAVDDLLDIEMAELTTMNLVEEEHLNNWDKEVKISNAAEKKQLNQQLDSKASIETDEKCNSPIVNNLCSQQEEKVTQNAREDKPSKFISCIKSDVQEAIERLECTSCEGQMIVVQQKTRLTIWSVSNNYWVLSKEYKVANDETVSSFCSLDSFVVLLVREERSDKIICLSFNNVFQDRILCLGYSSCTIPLLCRAGATRFACYTSREGSPLLSVYCGEDTKSIAMATQCNRINSLCHVRNLEMSLLGCGERQFVFWNSQTGELVRQIDLDHLNAEDTCLSVTAEEGLLFCLLATKCKENYRLLALNPVSGQNKLLQAYRQDSKDRCEKAAVVLEDGLHFASFGNNCSVQVWKILDGKLAVTIDSQNSVTSVQMTSGGKIFVGDRVGRVHVYCTRT